MRALAAHGQHIHEIRHAPNIPDFHYDLLILQFDRSLEELHTQRHDILLIIMASAEPHHQ
jgi:hypothetical protein